MTTPKPVADSLPRRILLGQFASAHGIRGDILIRTFTADPAAIASYGALSDKAGQKKFQIKIVRVTEKGVVARIAGVDDRNAAELLNGVELYVERDRLPPPSEDEFYHADLVGLDAELTDGRAVGTVVAVVNFGAGDLLDIRRADGSGNDYLAFTKVNVPVIDFAASRIVVVPPDLVGDPEPQDRNDGETL